MARFESRQNWYTDPFVKRIFKRDLDGLRASKFIIVLLLEANQLILKQELRYGLGKKLILIGDQKETESLFDF